MTMRRKEGGRGREREGKREGEGGRGRGRGGGGEGGGGEGGLQRRKMRGMADNALVRAPLPVAE